MAHPIVKLLFPQKASLDTAVAVLRVLAISVVFYGLSTLTNAVLQGIGKVNLPVWHALAALIVQVVVLVVLLVFTDMNLYALAIANICYSLLMCILNSRAVNKYLEYKENAMQTFVRPFFAAACMGVVAYGVYFVFALMMDERIALIPALLVAVIVYFIFVIKFRAVTEEELRAIPKGTKLVVAAKRLRLL